MSLTLDGTLQTQQDSETRNTIIELISQSAVDDIPFDGLVLNPSVTINEDHPVTIMHSSGRLLALHIEGPDGVTYRLVYNYTDVNRQEFSEVHVTHFALTDAVIEGVSFCELVNGNIGIIMLVSRASTYYLQYKIISAIGAIVTDYTVIASWATSIFTSAPCVIKKADDDYLLVYSKKSGSDYFIYKRTASDFTSWSGESALSIAGLTDSKRKSNPSLLQISSDDIFVWFDYVEAISGSSERINIYYSISDDNGITWDTAVQVTTYSTYSPTGLHPMAYQSVADNIKLIYTEKNASLLMDRNTSGWCEDEEQSLAMYLNTTTRLLYAVIGAEGTGVTWGDLGAVVEIDIDTWTITNCWNEITTPAFHTQMASQDCWGYNINKGAGNYVIVGLSGGSWNWHIQVLDVTANTITSYLFQDNGFDTTQNIAEWDKHDMVYGKMIACVDATNNRLYIAFLDSYLYRHQVIIGYIDLTQSGPIYTFNEIVHDNVFKGYDPSSFASRYELQVHPDSDYIIFGCGAKLSDDDSYGYIKIYSISTGSIIKDYVQDVYSTMPRYGFKELYFDATNNIMWGTTSYTEYQSEYKGCLCRLDLSTDSFTYFVPTWATLDEYGVNAICPTGDGRLLINVAINDDSPNSGIAVFDIATQSWALINNDTRPGLTVNDTNQFYGNCLTYDETTGNVIAGYMQWNADRGIVMFSLDSTLSQSRYINGTYSDPNWTFPFGSVADFVQGIFDYNAVIAYHPDDDSIYAFWVNNKLGELSIKWDKEDATFDLAPYLLRSDALTIKHTIDGSPAELKFSIGNGYLFDDFNTPSLFRVYLRKARKLVLRIGQVIEGTPYWVEQGTFYVHERRMTYERPNHPTMSIIAKDLRGFWQDHEVLATTNFATIPESVIDTFLTTVTSLLSEDISMGTWDTSDIMYAQWINMDISEILERIEDRFGYLIYMDKDNIVNAKSIDIDNAIDHTYTGYDWLFDFTPDDTFSDFTTEVLITTQERSQITVTYSEERVGTFHGTVGWWGFKQTYKHYYSDDESKVCVEPRLEVIESVNSIAFSLSGGTEEDITDVDPNNKWVEVTIEATDLRPTAYGLLGTIAGSYYIPDAVIYGETYPIGSYIRAFAIYSLFQVIGAIGNVQYEIFAKPRGQIRRKIQNTASFGKDLDFAAEIGFDVLKTISEPLCYTVGQCNWLADYTIEMIALQRRRATFSKVAHLQDEAGDIISIPHPSSGIAMKSLVVELVRKIKLPETNNDRGYFVDDVTVWIQ